MLVYLHNYAFIIIGYCHVYLRKKSLRSFWNEPGGLYELLKISIPASVSQACFSIMMFTDRLLLTPLGIEAPAASMVAGFTSFLFTVFFCGFLGYITPLTGQLIGAKREEKVTTLVHQGIIISLICYPIILFMGFYFAPVYFDWTGIPVQQKFLAQSYFNVINFGCFFTLFSVVFGSFFSGIGKTEVNMRVNIIGMLLNIPLSYYLINYGFLGYFKGVQGAAMGSLFSSMVMCVLFLVSFLKAETAKRFQSNLKLKLDLNLCKTLVKFGSATGIEMTLAFVCFSTFVAMFHSYGSSEALSATIALNWEILAFLPTWGISIGLMSLVGRYMGSRDLEKSIEVSRVVCF